MTSNISMDQVRVNNIFNLRTLYESYLSVALTVIIMNLSSSLRKQNIYLTQLLNFIWTTAVYQQTGIHFMTYFIDYKMKLLHLILSDSVNYLIVTKINIWLYLCIIKSSPGVVMMEIMELLAYLQSNTYTLKWIRTQYHEGRF